MENPLIDLKIAEDDLKKAAFIYKAMNHKLRQLILNLVHSSSDITVTQIHTRLSIEQSVASQQLAILRKADLVIPVRDGKYVFYKVNYKTLEKLNINSKNLLS